MNGRRQAQVRHPSCAWRPDLDRMTRRVAEQLTAEGHPWPEAAAAILADRGRLGLDRTAYASLSGIDPNALEALENGTELREPLLGAESDVQTSHGVTGPMHLGHRTRASSDSNSSTTRLSSSVITPGSRVVKMSTSDP